MGNKRRKIKTFTLPQIKENGNGYEGQFIIASKSCACEHCQMTLDELEEKGAFEKFIKENRKNQKVLEQFVKRKIR